MFLGGGRAEVEQQVRRSVRGEGGTGWQPTLFLGGDRAEGSVPTLFLGGCVGTEGPDGGVPDGFLGGVSGGREEQQGS